jgi:hypothetical protein
MEKPSLSILLIRIVFKGGRRSLVRQFYGGNALRPGSRRDRQFHE